MLPIGTTTITCTAGSGAGLTTKFVDAHVLTWGGKGVRSALIVVPATGAGTLEDQVAARLRADLIGRSVVLVVEDQSATGGLAFDEVVTW